MDEEMLNNISSMLKDGNIPDNIKDMMSNLSKKSSDQSNSSSSNNIDPNILSSLLSSFNSQTSENTNNTSENSNIDISTILKMKKIIDKMNQNQNDPRANLLRSLKPYLRSSRKDKLEQYVKLLNMSNVMEAFANNRW